MNGVVTDFVRKLRQDPNRLEVLGDGRQCKPYLHVSECVDAILLAFGAATRQVNLFNLGVESATEVNKIARIVGDELGLVDVQLVYTGGDRGWKGDVPQLRFNIDKVKRLGWQPKLSSDQAVSKSVRELMRELR
jgi:UDP-glucose 4-epimerase